MEKFNTNPIKQIRNRIRNAETVNIVLGAGDVWYGTNWIATNVEELDVTDPENWAYLFDEGSIDNILAEHVWEHLTPQQAYAANENIKNYLKPRSGNFRLAVPDGLHPNKEYIDYVKPGGTGAGAQDHKVLYNFVTITRMLKRSGFMINLLEYWDGDHNFNHDLWDTTKGFVKRSLRYDERNIGGTRPIYTSLIVDAKVLAPHTTKAIADQAMTQWDIDLNEIEQPIIQAE